MFVCMSVCVSVDVLYAHLTFLIFCLFFISSEKDRGFLSLVNRLNSNFPPLFSTGEMCSFYKSVKYFHGLNFTSRN